MNGGTSATPPEERRGGPIAIMRDFPGFWVVFKYGVT
jgi:hypothetical protein